MKTNRKIIFLSGSLLLTLGVGMWWFAAQTGARTATEKVTHPLEMINQKAEAARHGDAAAGSELTGEIINASGFEGELRGFTAERVKDRVGRAEAQFRQGQSAGIPEAKVVSAINQLARQFELPEFARTNPYEVRRLRVSLYPYFPQLIKLDTGDRQALIVGERIESTMSPAEAFLIFSMMIQQKMANESYQMTRDEQTRHWAAIHDRHAAGDGDLEFTKSRGDELREALERGAKKAAATDIWQITDTTLDNLGIE